MKRFMVAVAFFACLCLYVSAAPVEVVFADDNYAVTARVDSVQGRLIALRPAIDQARRRTWNDGFVILAKTSGAYPDDRLLNIGLENMADNQVKVCDPEEVPELMKKLSLLSRSTDTALIPSHNWQHKFWRDRCLEKQREILANESRVFDAVFIGDSITHNFERGDAYGIFKQWGGFGKEVWDETFKGLKVLNLGISADWTQHVLWRLTNGELENYRAKTFVIMLGTNNSWSCKPERTAAALKEIIDLVRSKNPQSKVILYAVFPRGKTPDDIRRKRNEKLNEIIKGFADGENVIWRDINSKLLNADGTMEQSMMADYLHPTPKGYRIWADDVLPLIRKYLSTKIFVRNLKTVDTAILKLSRNDERMDKANAWRPRKEYTAKAPYLHAGILNHFVSIRRQAEKFTNGVDVILFSNGNLGGLKLDPLTTLRVPSGNSFDEALWYAQTGSLDLCKAKYVVVCMNLGHDLHEKRAIPGMEKLVAVIKRVLKSKKNGTKIILIPAIPGGVNSEDEMRKRNLRFDAATRALADGKDVIWCDYTSGFYTADDGRVRDDYQKGEFNLTAPAFEAMAAAIKATVAGKPPVTAAVKAPPYPERELTIMSYNIRYMQGGSDDNWEPGRAVEVIRKVRPDVLGVQEINRFNDWTFGIDEPTALGHMINPLWRYEYAAGSSNPDTKASDGVATYALEDAVSVKRIPLPDKNGYGRVLLAVEYPEFWVANSHFSLYEEERLKAVEIIGKFAKTVKKPLFILGDWNAEPKTATMTEMRKHFKILSDEKVLTFSSSRPHATIDYIGIDKAHADKVKVLSYNVLHEPYASDHMPLVMKVVISR